MFRILIKIICFSLFALNVYLLRCASYEHSENMLGALRNPPRVVTVRGRLSQLILLLP